MLPFHTLLYALPDFCPSSLLEENKGKQFNPQEEIIINYKAEEPVLESY